MELRWQKPNDETLTDYKRSYIDLVPEGSLISALENSYDGMMKVLKGLQKEKVQFRYAPNKWNIAEILIHIIDTERIFAYRILRIARGDATPLPGYDQDDYVKTSNVNERAFMDVLEEYQATRNATITLLKSLNSAMLSNTGVIYGTNVTVNELAYMIAGHEIHHFKLIKEKYI